MNYFCLVLALCCGSVAGAQNNSLALRQGSAQGLSATPVLQRQGVAIQAGFVSTNTRLKLGAESLALMQHAARLTAWKGEKVHAQVVVKGGADVVPLSISVSDLQSGKGHRVGKENMAVGFVGYVLTDTYGKGCEIRKPQDFDSSLVADPIDTQTKTIQLAPGAMQPVWVSIRVPAGTPAGDYRGTVTVQAGKSYPLDLALKVVDRTLPPPAQWSFQLDLWQHPAAIARVHGVPLWSEAHFALMKPYYTLLAGAGQKNVTASIVHEPWGHQTYDDFPSLIKWTKKKDGSWQYDYRLFDRYVAFVMSCGINQRINCYSMVPWKIAFPYYDERAGKDTVFTEAIGTEAYNDFWRPMLRDFTRHLREKGWFGKTAIAMDERPMPAMQAVIKLLKEVDPEWKVALAGAYHPEIEADVFDYCIASRLAFPADTLQLRKQQGKYSTWYTCCAEPFPNGFTFSPPAEHVWIGWYTAASGMDGYLRWAYNSWPAKPLSDSRFTSWPAGDTYQVYPGPLSSIRFEKLIEGIQDFEKINILKKAYQQDEAKRLALQKVLAGFTIAQLERQPATEQVERAREFLNQ